MESEDKHNFSFGRKRCAAKIKSKSLLMIQQSLQFNLLCVQKMILYQIVVRISKRQFLSMTLCTSLMRGTSRPMYILNTVLLSTLKLLQKSARSTENGITFPDPAKNSSAIRATMNITVLLMSSMAVLSF